MVRTLILFVLMLSACAPIDLEADPAVDSGHVDAGARDGGTPRDVGPARDAGPVAPEDVTSDGCVDSSDLDLVQAEWGVPGSQADVDGNGTVDVRDLNRVLAAWGTGCPDAGVHDGG